MMARGAAKRERRVQMVAKRILMVCIGEKGERMCGVEIDGGIESRSD